MNPDNEELIASLKKALSKAELKGAHSEALNLARLLTAALNARSEGSDTSA